MRCYHFCNMYLAGVHAGIQSAHAQHELAIKYLASTPYHNLATDESMNECGARLADFHDVQTSYIDWATNHKTMILLNAGMHGDLLKIEEFLDSYKNHESNRFPYASFREAEYALNGALTNVCIVLPKEMYEYNRYIQSFEQAPWPGYESFSHDGVIFDLRRNQDLTVDLSSSGEVIFTYNQFDLELIKRMSTMKLM